MLTIEKQIEIKEIDIAKEFIETMLHNAKVNADVIATQEDNLIKITNDGTPPKGIIKEGGGLSSLRSLIEKENGKMIVNSEPQFELIIDLRGEKK